MEDHNEVTKGVLTMVDGHPGALVALGKCMQRLSYHQMQLLLLSLKAKDATPVSIHSHFKAIDEDVYMFFLMSCFPKRQPPPATLPARECVVTPTVQRCTKTDENFTAGSDSQSDGKSMRSVTRLSSCMPEHTSLSVCPTASTVSAQDDVIDESGSCLKKLQCWFA